MTDTDPTDHTDAGGPPFAPDKERPDAPDVEMDPEDHLSRPEQPDFDPAEREQYEHPPVSIADADRPEDR